MSIPAVRNLILRIADTAKPARLLYVSDFDPGGQSMPRAVSRKAEWLIAHDDFNVDLRLFPIVLTAAQVEKYRLPRTPIKETERRRATFEERHGEGAVELDALEALRPGEFRRIIEEAIGRYRDNTLQHRFEMARAQCTAPRL